MFRRLFAAARLGRCLAAGLMAGWAAGLPALPAAAQQADNLARGVGTPTARLVRAEGTVDIVNPQTGALKRELTRGDDVRRGEVIAVSQPGRAELYLTDGSRLRLAAGTELRLRQIYFAPEIQKGRFSAGLRRGLVVARPGGLERLADGAFHLVAGAARLEVASGPIWLAREADAATAGTLPGGRGELIAGGGGVGLARGAMARSVGGAVPSTLQAPEIAKRARQLLQW